VALFIEEIRIFTVLHRLVHHLMLANTLKQPSEPVFPHQYSSCRALYQEEEQYE
jgi:hypothetical protein